MSRRFTVNACLAWCVLCQNGGWMSLSEIAEQAKISRENTVYAVTSLALRRMLH